MTTNHDSRLLGRTGLRVSPIALGTLTFGEGGWHAGKDTARSVFRRYLESGGNFIDTAVNYAGGQSEELLGAFLEETGTREQIVLATKFGFPVRPGDPNAAGNGRKNILASLDLSLRRLRTDFIDLYWLHVWDGVTPVEEVLSTLDALVRSGKMRAIGLSNTPAWYAAKAQLTARERGWEPVAALQLEYSLAERSIEREHVPAALDLGMGIVAWSPLANGLLAANTTRTRTGSRTGAADWPGWKPTGPSAPSGTRATRRSPSCSPAGPAPWWTCSATAPAISAGHRLRSRSTGCPAGPASPAR